MLRAFNRKGALLFLAVLVAVCTSCQKHSISTVRLGDWIQQIVQEAQLPTAQQQSAYYINVPSTSMDYDAVQAAVEWNVLQEEYAFDPEAQLTKEWVAYTLVNLAGMNQESSKINIKDIQKTQFSSQVQTAVASGLMQVDDRGCFEPKKLVSRQEADLYLQQILNYINHRTIDTPVNEVEWNEDFQPTEVEPISYQSDLQTAVFPSGSNVQPEEYVSWEEEDGSIQYYQVDTAKETEEGIETTLKEVDPSDAISSMDVENSFTIDFTQVEIIDGILEDESSSYVQPSGYTFVSTRPLQKTIDVGDFKITFQTTSSGIKVEATKAMKFGGKFFALLNLYSVKPTYCWKTNGTTIEDGYFKVDFKTNESIGLKTSNYKTLYGDFSRVDPQNFLSSIQGLFQEKKDVVEGTLDICTIKVPIPSAPFLKITMTLQLKLYASGRVELSLTQNNSLGMEIRNNSMRPICESDHTSQNVIKADTGLMAGIRFGLELVSLRLADISIDAGAKATVSATVHLYDSKGNKSKASTELPADLVDEMAEENPDVLVCGDIKAYWQVDVSLNSSKSMAGKIGLSNTFHLLNADNAPLIPGMKTHIENWQFMDHCTREDRTVASPKPSMPTTDSIKIADYSLILNPSESTCIQVTGLPQGLSLSDLSFTSKDPGIARVDASGNVVAVSSGSTIVTISSKDQKFSVRCTVLVRTVSTS